MAPRPGDGTYNFMAREGPTGPAAFTAPYGLGVFMQYFAPWYQRKRKVFGVTDEQNEALDNWQAATCFDETQRAALAFTDEIVKLHKPTDATFNAIRAKLSPAALVELQLSVGFYIMTSKFLETFAIDLQPVSEVVS